MTHSLPILSVRQPFAWAIIYGGKDIENRSWRTHQRGRILIHAGTKEEDDDAYEFVKKQSKASDNLIDYEDDNILTLNFDYGGIIGSVEIVDCIDNQDYRAKSPWFMGKYGYVLRNPKPLPFKALRGRLGFFTDPAAANFDQHADSNQLNLL